MIVWMLKLGRDVVVNQSWQGLGVEGKCRLGKISETQLQSGHRTAILELDILTLHLRWLISRPSIFFFAAPC